MFTYIHSPVMARGHKLVTVHVTGCGFDPQISIWQNAALSSAMQHSTIFCYFSNSVESKWQSVVTLGSLCLPYMIQRESDFMFTFFIKIEIDY